jgi:hypothetical protein
MIALSTSALGSDENRHHADVSTTNGASPRNRECATRPTHRPPRRSSP